MLGRPMLAGLAGGALVLGGITRRYRRDLAAAHARLRAHDRRVVPTAHGALEYAERGAGAPVLVSHGIFHGCDGGLLSTRDLVVDRRVIAPSRFGYLGSSMPPAPSAAAQADVFVELLDHLRLEGIDVIAISAGTGAGVQMALRHPGRVRHLVISSGNFPGSPTATAPPDWAEIFYSDPAMWALEVFVRPAFAKLMGIPSGFPQDPEQARVVAELLDSIFPVGLRAEGAMFDAYVSNPEIDGYPLEALGVPTLIIHAKDDPLASYESSVAAAERIPDAVLVGLESGGHLQLGQTERVRAEISSFLGTPVASRP